MAIDLGDIPTGTPPTAGEKLQIRSAIGVGQTDSPTFAGLTSTGEIVGRSGSYGTPTLRGGAGNAYQWISASALGVVTGGGITTFQTGTNAGVSYIAVGDDITLYRDAAGILAQRNGTSTQQFRLYNTTDAGNVNYERLELKFTSGAFQIQTARGGGGLRKSLIFGFEDNAVFGISKDSAVTAAWWNITASGHLLCAPDNTYDIGASGANRPRNIYVGSDVMCGSLRVVNINTANNSHSVLTFTNSSDNLLFASGQTSSRINFCGTTSAFPAIKRNGTGIDIRLADDSAFAPVKGKLTTDTAYTATTVVATGYITLYDSTGTAYRVPCAV
jgi:hypothetical protein